MHKINIFWWYCSCAGCFFSNVLFSLLCHRDIITAKVPVEGQLLLRTWDHLSHRTRVSAQQCQGLCLVRTVQGLAQMALSLVFTEAYVILAHSSR